MTKDWAELVRRQLDKAIAAGQKMTYAEAESEVVADASEYMLQESQFVKNMDAGLKNKVKRIMQDFMAKIRAAFKALAGGHEESVALRTMRDGVRKYSDRLQQLWDAGFMEMATAKVRETQSEESTGTVEDVRHSIREFNDGTKYVHVDTDQQIFNGLQASEYAKAARNYIRDHFRNKVIGTSVRAYVRRESENEYTLPAKKNIPPALYEGKMKAATELDNLLDASVFLTHEYDDGRHPDAVRGWDKYRTIFEVDGRFFEGIVTLKKIQKGDVFYDVTKIRDITGPMRAKYSNELQYPGQGDILTDSIPQTSEPVNGNIQKSVREKRETEYDRERAKNSEYGIDWLSAWTRWTNSKNGMSRAGYAMFSRRRSIAEKRKTSTHTQSRHSTPDLSNNQSNNKPRPVHTSQAGVTVFHGCGQRFFLFTAP